ncbi:Non-heme 11 kDa protein of cytochrome bc1 complex [Westerdykella ornata]|uniref:Cytochrome b-c1 complex subunit 6, mitochondrial n=1 Tax=Westerdykella ornata TaxID=318751 RepID=A0A6A6JKH0_WESOR|nr:Non-heme 11 kDa protein of cytochrome bc1 complex [Westerdykella ornata]KAF2276725.1 Non-heme 11 kDa protein of cytochrome bc1 complex [Westerdykella ornata]
MGITDFISAAWDTFSHPSPDAEAPPKGGVSTETPAAGTGEESKEEAEVNVQDKVKGGEEPPRHVPGTEKDERAVTQREEAEEAAEEEEEEEEEEETVDPKVVLEEECANSKQCSSVKHHYDECVERVTAQVERDGKPNEDCVEEFFHLVHCATNCAAPKLFAQLK